MLRIRARLLGTARQTLKGSFADIGKSATGTATVFPQTAIDVFSEKTDQRHLQQENKQELQQQNKDLFLQEKKRDLQREKRDLQQTEIKQDLFLHNKTVFQEEADFTTTFAGIASAPFSDRIALLLGAPIPPEDIEVKPDGLLYLPEIRYRRILNTSFGPGGWGLVPRGPHSVIDSTLTREYALFCDGRFVAQARGEQDFFSPAGLPTATEGYLLLTQMQVKRNDAVLQGPRHCLAAVGPGLHSLVQADARGAGVGRARGKLDAEAAVAAHRRCSCISLP